ncbi:unnamed protein product [Ciceribacter selenitireducens ATCC BAA-1503]|uniref:Uncharacterized protein n=1 Tax=Ciceribacter selenitireducens ATCC BAA-1503 TaxID=1336235 RepID=A0A376AC00_9HYPH|nr:unnamed protein product [Ciceribacter selenitireducens ATCC BAA-1503]
MIHDRTSRQHSYLMARRGQKPRVAVPDGAIANDQNAHEFA